MKIINIYERDAHCYIQPMCQSVQGPWIGCDSVQTLKSDSDTGLFSKALSVAASASLVGVPHPSNWDTVMVPLLKSANVKSWAIFMKGSKSCTIEMTRNGINIIPTVNSGSRKGFEHKVHGTICLPHDAPWELIAVSARQAIDDSY